MDNIKIITSYDQVKEKVESILSTGISSDQILLVTDWDEVITTGTWQQKDNQGNYFKPDKRILTESEGDVRLRDPNVPDILKEILDKDIDIMVATARPPIRDINYIPITKELYNIPDFLNLRCINNQDRIDYDKICIIIKEIIHLYGFDDLVEEAYHKIQIMETYSGVRLTYQSSLKGCFGIQIDDEIIVYQDGYAFLGHNKGVSLLEVLKQFDEFPLHIIVVDDNPKVIESYRNSIERFREHGSTLHILYYPQLTGI